MSPRRSTLLGLFALCGLLSAPARADSVADFYRGKTIRLVIGSGEGGGFDISARVAAQFLSRHIPGNPSVVPQNMPGASGVVAASYMYRIAPEDGTVICITEPATLINAVMAAQPTYVMDKFTWIGRFAALATYGVVGRDAPVKTLEAAKSTSLIMAAAPGAGPGVTVTSALNALVGTKFKVIQGYKSVAESGFALERGEVQGISSVSWEFLRSRGWTGGNKVTFIYVNALTRDPKIPDVPTIVEAATNDEARGVLRFISSTSDIGRALLAPPNVPAERIEALRQAFDELVKDPDFIAEAQRQGLDAQPLSGVKLQKLIAGVVAIPPATAEKAREILPKP